MDVVQSNGEVFQTRILPVNTENLGQFKDGLSRELWGLPRDQTGLEVVKQAAQHLKNTNIPVGFPTETVYGLGADATRSDAVKGIYKAKGRPSDNPLIIHVCDLTMLRNLLFPMEGLNGETKSVDPIPAIYKPLIEAFWPGPLTILLPNPRQSKLAPEVTAGLPTFGVRMPDSPLALSLIYLAGVPLAAPSANASTKPSPTTAQHVLHDLNGRIDIILDGGPCQVGVESTVVDGLCIPPVILRPGGISIDQLRECKGWERVVKGYKDQSEEGSKAPRAPGMKYKHYSPKAKVVLYESHLSNHSNSLGKISFGIPSEACKILTARQRGGVPHLGYESLERSPKIGIVSTKHWKPWAQFHMAKWGSSAEEVSMVLKVEDMQTENSFQMKQGELWQAALVEPGHETTKKFVADLIQISLGQEIKDIAHGLFSALRELDQRGADVIYVEGIGDEEDIAAAVMNRLRKAATIIET